MATATGPTPGLRDAPQPDQALRLQVLRRTHHRSSCPASSSAWSGPTAAASPTSSTRCAGCWARARPASCAASRCRT
ncbi:MAG: hypothetical protein MZW92_72900 [Comamonadaceae bacterium]|nr:hypothetical protein [Comamonadaceae bacterium]